MKRKPYTVQEKEILLQSEAIVKVTNSSIIWKSVLRGQMVRLFWVIGTVRDFEGQEVIKPFVHKRDYSDFFRTWTDGVIILGKTCFYILQLNFGVVRGLDKWYDYFGQNI